MHYRLSVTVRMKVLQNGRLVRFSKRKDCRCAFRAASVTKRPLHQLYPEQQFPTYTDHEKTSSAERNSGRKTKLNERNRRTLKRIMSKNHRTAAARVTAKLNIHLEDPVSSQTVRRELHKSNIHGRAAIVKPLITENKSKKRKR